jgi:hypothetical protein
MKLTAIVSVIIGSLSAVAFLGYFAVNQKSEFLETPDKDTYAIILIVNKSGKMAKLRDFSNRMRSYASGSTGNEVSNFYYMENETAEHFFIRINKKSNLNSNTFDTSLIEGEIENIIKLEDMNGIVEYGFIDDKGNLVSTGSFKPSLLP